MDINAKNLEIVYKQIFEVSLQISGLIERELYNDLIGYIEKKDRLLSESAALLSKAQKSGENLEFLKPVCEKIQIQELENMKALSLIKDKIREQLKNNTENKKFVSAYSGHGASKGNILDFRE